MFFSIIIPFYNRASELSNCLISLFNQDFEKSDFEIIVVNDGSTESFPEISIPDNIKLKIIDQKNFGQSKARNTGIHYANGEYILFIDADVVASPSLLSAHREKLLKHPYSASLGNISFPTDEDIDLISMHSDLGYFFREYQDSNELSFIQFITCNIAISKDLLLKVGCFSEEFTGYGYEDIELGYRLYKEFGTRVFFSKNALAYHLHKRDLKEFTEQQNSLGRAQVILASIHPEITNHIKLDLNMYYDIFRMGKINKLKDNIKKIAMDLSSSNIEKYKLLCRIDGIHQELLPHLKLKLKDCFIRPEKKLSILHGNASLLSRYLIDKYESVNFPLLNDNIINRYRSFNDLFDKEFEYSNIINISKHKHIKGGKILKKCIPFFSKKRLSYSDIKSLYNAVSALRKYDFSNTKKILFVLSFLKIPLNIYRYYRNGLSIKQSILFAMLDKIVFIIRSF